MLMCECGYYCKVYKEVKDASACNTRFFRCEKCNKEKVLKTYLITKIETTEKTIEIECEEKYFNEVLNLEIGLKEAYEMGIFFNTDRQGRSTTHVEYSYNDEQLLN